MLSHKYAPIPEARIIYQQRNKLPSRKSNYSATLLLPLAYWLARSTNTAVTPQEIKTFLQSNALTAFFIGLQTLEELSGKRDKVPIQANHKRISGVKIFFFHIEMLHLNKLPFSSYWSKILVLSLKMTVF